jgi:hypothetical protein
MARRARVATNVTENNNRSELVPYTEWLRKRSSVTNRGWRRRRWTTTANIAGRHYFNEKEIERFNPRPARGEFAKTATVPGKEIAA